MYKQRRMLLLLLAVLFAGTQAVHAQATTQGDLERRQAGTGMEEYGEHTPSSYLVLGSNYAFNYDDENNHGIYLNGRMGYDFHPNMAFEVESGWLYSDFEVANVDAGELTMVPILGNLVLKAPMENFTPYVSGGFGAFFFDVNENEALGDIDIDNWEVGFKAAAGADFWMTENLALNLESGFFFVPDPDVTGAAIPGGEIEGGVDNWYVGGGLKFRFA